MQQVNKQAKKQSWARASHRAAALSRNRDERPASWKVLLPHRADARLLAVDADPATVAALSRNFDAFDCINEIHPAPLGEGYDIIVCGCMGRDGLRSRLNPGGVWVSLGQPLPQGLVDVRRYALLSPDKPRMILPLEPRRSRSAGLRFHRPTNPHTRLLARFAALLSDLGISRHVGPAHVIMGSAPGNAVGQKLGEWLNQQLGRPVGDLIVYTGSDAPHRKITVQALGTNDTADVVVKLADTVAAEAAIRRETDGLRLLVGTGLEDSAPRSICTGSWGGYFVAVRSMITGKPSEVMLTDVHMAMLRRLASIGPSTQSMRCTRLWREAHERRRDDDAARLARLDQLDAEQIIPCHLVHGDFAPWNLQRRGAQLLAIDWEDADAQGEACTDAFHFIFRSASLVGPWPGGAVVAGRMRFAAAHLGATRLQIDPLLRLWLAREAWSQPMAHGHAVETLASLQTP